MAPESTKSVEVDPGTMRISDGYLVHTIDRCTCDGGGEFPHRSWCGEEPLIPLASLAVLMSVDGKGDFLQALRTVRALIPADEVLVITGDAMEITSRAYYATGTSQFTVKRKAT